MDVGSMSWAQVLACLGGSTASYRLESHGGRVKLSVDGLHHSLLRVAEEHNRK